MLLNLLKNKIFIYLGARYGTYALQFIVSIAIATRLGPYYLGIYGFINLILSYFTHLNFGVPHSLNVLIIHNKNDYKKSGNYIANSLWLYFLVSMLVLILFLIVKYFNIQLNKDYTIDKYLFLIALIAILTYINSILSTVLRVRNKVVRLSVVQSLNVLINLIVVSLFNGELLVTALVLCNLLSNVIVLLICVCSNILPDFRETDLSLKVQKEILHKGFYLFMYNSCFYFITISIRTIVCGNYCVEDFGAFTFSFTIANAVMLLLDSLLTIIFPKIIDLLSSNNLVLIEHTLNNIRIGYISSSHLMIYTAMIFFPIILLLAPQYENSLTTMNLISLAVLMNTNSCGYSSLLIAQNKEKTSAVISLLALLSNIILGVILASVLKVNFSYIILATLLTYLFFSFMCVWKGKALLGMSSFEYALKNFFPIRLLIPYLCALIISCFRIEFLIWTPLTVYIIFNWHDLRIIKKMAIKIVNNSNIADI